MAINPHELFYNRFSCLGFDPQRPISKEMIVSILEAARWSPSGCNRQPWRFIVCQDASLRDRIAHCTYKQEFIKNSPCIVVLICSSEVNEMPLNGARIHEFEARQVFDPEYRKDILVPYVINKKEGGVEIIRDCAMTAYAMMLHATALCMGSCWTTLDKVAILELFGLDPLNHIVVCAIPIGNPLNDISPKPPRLPLGATAFRESMEKAWG